MDSLQLIRRVIVMPIHLECGVRNAIAFVFSCPGRKEQQECRPAAGPTGDNLEEVLRVMGLYDYDDMENLERDDWTRENIWITNSWSCVEYKERTGRSEATISQILETENILRLANELGVIENVIVCCGDKAQRAVCCLYNRGKLHCTVKIVSLCHLGNQALNRWIQNSELNQDRFETPEQRRLERLRRWAGCLYNEITTENSSSC